MCRCVWSGVCGRDVCRVWVGACVVCMLACTHEPGCTHLRIKKFAVLAPMPRTYSNRDISVRELCLLVDSASHKIRLFYNARCNYTNPCFTLESVQSQRSS